MSPSPSAMPSIGEMTMKRIGLIQPEAMMAPAPALATAAPPIPAEERVRRGTRQPEPPGDEVPDDGADQRGQDDVRVHCGRVDQALADGLGDRGAHHERGDEVEERRPEDRHAGREDPGRDDGRDGVGAVVEAVDEVEQQRDADDREDEPDGASMIRRA